MWHLVQVHRYQRFQKKKTCCLHHQDISSILKIDTAHSCRILVSGYLSACHCRGLNWSQASPCGIWGGQSGVETGFSPSTWFSPVGAILPVLPNSYFIPLTSPVLYDLRSWLCLCHLSAKLHGAMSQKICLHIFHCGQLVQNHPIIKFNVLMEIPELWLQTTRVHLSSPNCVICGWT